MQFERRTEASATARLLRPDTCEVSEQSWATSGGGDGGKRSDQREPATARRVPDTEPDGSDGTALPCLRDWVSDYRCGLVPRGFDISPDLNTGGERGIRTPDTRKGIHAFEARAFSHSAISPIVILSGKLSGFEFWQGNRKRRPFGRRCSFGFDSRYIERSLTPCGTRCGAT